MKKLSFLGLILVLCSFVIGVAMATPTQAQTNTQANTQVGAATSDDQNLNITSDMLGMHGPFSLSTIYSKTYGLILQGKYLQLLNPTNAFALELDGGKAERRVGITWGHVLTPNQRFKLSAENLSQRMNFDFDFDSGNVSKWVSQNAIGGTYEYLLSNKFVKDLNLNAYCSKAKSRDLGFKDFIQDGHRWRNFRRIAGATDKSGSLGIDVSPAKSTLIGLQLNYDKVKYNTRYENSNNDSSGLGATVSLHQLVNQHVQFSLLASDRKPYKDYQAEVDWLLHSAPGTQLQLGLIGERMDGNLGLPNDNRVGLNLSYSWGGDSNQSATFSDPVPNNDASGLKDWTNTPAVHMSQVLAIKDQKTVDMGVVSPKPIGKKNDEGFYWNKDIYDGSAIKEDTGQSFDLVYGKEQTPEAPHNALIYSDGIYNHDITTIKCDDLSQYSNLHCVLTHWQNAGNYMVEVKGTISQADFDKAHGTIIFNINATRDDGKTATVTFTFVQKNAPIVIDPQTIAPAAFKVGQPAKVALATITANCGTIDVGSIKLDHNLVKDHGLTLNTDDCVGKKTGEAGIVYLESSNVTKATVGEPEKDIKLSASNKDSNNDASYTFDLTVAGPPVVTNPSLGDKSYKPQDTIKPIDLSGHFKSPNKQSGDITGYVLKDEAGHDKAYFETEYGLQVQGNQVVADHAIISDAQSDDIEVYATNNIPAQKGQEQCATYKLTIQRTVFPTIVINSHVNDNLVAGHQVPKDTWVADVKANGGYNVDPDSIATLPEDLKHNITLNRDRIKTDCTGKAECKIYLQSSNVKDPNFTKDKDINFTAGNTSGGSASTSFNLAVKGVPVEQGGDFKQAQIEQGEKAIIASGVPNHFKYPLGTKNTGYVFQDGDYHDLQSAYGLSVDASGNLVANVPLNATLKTVDVHVFAKNSAGLSKDSAVCKLTVTHPTASVTGCHQKFTIDKTCAPAAGAIIQVRAPEGVKIEAKSVITSGASQFNLYMYPIGAGYFSRIAVRLSTIILAVGDSPGEHTIHVKYTIKNMKTGAKYTETKTFTINLVK